MRQAQLTFAMARHALVDLGHVFHIQQRLYAEPGPNRLPEAEFSKLCASLSDMHMKLCGDPSSMRRLTAIRELYEPQALALANYLCLELPQWSKEPKKNDAWKQVAELRRSPEFALKAAEHISESSITAGLLDDEHGLVD